CLAAGGRRISPKGRAHDARAFFASTWMCCRKTPEPERGPVGQDARRAPDRGGLSLGYFSLATQREVTRAGRRPVRNAFDFDLAVALASTSNKAPFAGQGERQQCAPSGPSLHQLRADSTAPRPCNRIPRPHLLGFKPLTSRPWPNPFTPPPLSQSVEAARSWWRAMVRSPWAIPWSRPMRA